MNRQNKYQTLFDNTLLISLGTFSSKLLSFLMVRFYTGVLSPSDYGAADLITQTANLLFPLVSMGITDGVFRFALTYPERRRNVFTVGLYTVTAGSLLLLMLSPLMRNVAAFSEYAKLIVFYTAASCYHALCAGFIRANGKTALFAGQGVLNTALVIGLNILFLAFFQMGITGYVLSVALSDTLCTIFLIYKEKLWHQIVLHPEKKIFSRMLKYSIPLIPTTVFWWITSVSDRYMITAFLGSDANGIYTVACKLPTMLTLLSSVFLEAWKFSAVSESRENRRTYIRFYSQIWSSFSGFMTLAGSIVIACSHIGVRLLSTEEYFSAWQYVPVLSTATVFASFVTFMGSVYMVTGKSGQSFLTAMAGALVNLLLNAALIPGFGIQGAAVATLASYFVSFVLRAVSARRLIPFRLYTGRLFANMFVLAVQTVFSVRELPMQSVVQGICILLLTVLNVKPIAAAFRKIAQMRKEKRLENR